jgi:hypothetical protein
MTRDEARQECERLRREHPDRATNTWIPREVDGEWQIVRAPLPPGMRRDALKATVETKPRPQQSDDAPLWQSTGGVPPGVGPG